MDKAKEKDNQDKKTTRHPPEAGVVTGGPSISPSAAAALEQVTFAVNVLQPFPRIDLFPACQV